MRTLDARAHSQPLRQQLWQRNLHRIKVSIRRSRRRERERRGVGGEQVRRPVLWFGGQRRGLQREQDWGRGGDVEGGPDGVSGD